MQKSLTIAQGVRSRALSQHQVLLLLSTVAVIVMANMYTTQPILPQIGKEFGLLPSEAGLTMSILIMSLGLSSFVYGFILDRFGPRQVMTTSILALVFPTLLCAMSPNITFLVVARAGQGLVLPGVVSGVQAYLHSEFTTKRGMAMGFYTAATIVGGFSGRLMGGVLTDFFNWRGAFIGFAMFNLLAFMLVLNFLPEAQHFKLSSNSKGKGQKRVNPLSHLKNDRLFRVYIIAGAIFFPFLGMFTYLPYYLIRPPFDLSTLLVSFVFVVYLVGILSAPLSGKLSDRYGRRSLIIAGLLMMSAGIALTLVQNLPVLIAGLILICFGMFTTQSSNNALLGENVPEGNGRGSAVSLQQVFFYLSGSTGGVTLGLLWQGGGWLPVVIACELSVVVGLVAAWTFSKKGS